MTRTTRSIEPVRAAPEQGEPGLLSSPFRALSVGIVMAVSLAGFEGLGVTTAMPDASAELNGDRLYGWAFSAFQLSLMVGTVAAGALADRYGPGRPLRTGLGVFTLGLLLGSTAPTMTLLVLSRGLTGLGAGAIFSLNSVLIGRVYPARLQSRMLALSSAAWITPGLVGPALAGWITDHAGWRWVFAAFLPIVPVITVLLLPAVRRLGIDGSPALPVTGDQFWDATHFQRTRDAVITAVGVGIALGGLSSSRPIAFGGLVLLGIAIAARPLWRLLPRGTFRAARGLPATTVSVFLIMGAFIGTEVFLPFALTRSRGASSALAGLILSVGTLTWSVGSWLQSRDPPRWGTPARVSASALLLGAGIAATGIITVASTPGLVAYAGWACGGLGMGLVFNAVSALTYTLVEPARVGVAIGATGLAGGLGAAVAAGVSGALVNAGDSRYGGGVMGVRWALAFQAGLGVLAAIVVFRAPGRGPGRVRRRDQSAEQSTAASAGAGA